MSEDLGNCKNCSRLISRSEGWSSVGPHGEVRFCLKPDCFAAMLAAIREQLEGMKGAYGSE